MFWLKSCPRCNGDLSEGKDKYGRYVSCLQCGYRRIEPQDIALQFLPLVRMRSPSRKLIYAKTWRWQFPYN